MTSFPGREAATSCHYDNGTPLALNSWLEGPAMTQAPAGPETEAESGPAFFSLTLTLTQHRPVLSNRSLVDPVPHDHLGAPSVKASERI